MAAGYGKERRGIWKNLHRSITFYDIASGPPVRCFAPNPWKTRYALNFKRVHGSGLQYTTAWVPLPDVGRVRASLGAAPVRKHDVDGGDFPTLPVIVDHCTSASLSSPPDGKKEEAGLTADVVVGDSFDIALHLDRAHPTSPPLLPPRTAALHRAFNAHADRVFTAHVALAAHGMPLDPATAHLTHDEFCRRSGRPPGSWEELAPRGAARAEMLAAFEAALGELAAFWGRPTCTENDDGGDVGTSSSGGGGGGSPFLEGGEVPMYADLIVGAWLQMMRVCLPEWETLRGWHGGLWGRLNDALERYAQGD